MGKRIKRLLPAVLAGLLLLSACGGRSGESADLSSVLAEIERQTDLPECIDLSEKAVMNRYGIRTSEMTQAFFRVARDGLRVDEIWLVEAPDEEAARAVADTAERHVQQVLAETRDYLPDQYAVAQGAVVVCRGKYAALFLSPETDAMEEILLRALGD